MQKFSYGLKKIAVVFTLLKPRLVEYLVTDILTAENNRIVFSESRFRTLKDKEDSW